MAARKALVKVAKETQSVLPSIVQHLPDLDPSSSERLDYTSLPPLQPNSCPKRTHPGTLIIRVVQEDSLNAAIQLASTRGQESGRVVVLSNANARIPGGPWLQGAMAQEEEICYRSSLSLSLHEDLYPWTGTQGIYTPDVVVIRDDVKSGHNLLHPDTEASNLPVVSVISIAAPTRLKRVTEGLAVNNGVQSITAKRAIYKNPHDRDTMKMKMRFCLRIAASKGHGLLVLGALGCGAFGNPRDDVAECWLEVLREKEFGGGWWEEVWFAVLDPRGDGNFGVFRDVLDGMRV
ncbi:hypothetical protein BBK36DRAFT_163480 [Trichoderma citrinoviride]|uniref:Microbial-type PARG catalytic domain-containing protein n=1 Tax=Trichoderma citrinoviride TaxID=58853 RepID=A0A2T4B8E4_9HYPO|nr:hypothetical protein BBK36DRAFT_163480 [Trichoderma citrinoviride]PTB65596.1 hypothetical protein BBK36DRAFT_163480 [Trichoderma citrinoviride]